MLTLTDVLHKINNDVRNQIPVDEADISDHISKSLRDFNVAISDDVEQTVSNFKEKYGEGNIYHFPLIDYAHGKEIAFALFRHLTGQEPRGHTQTPEFSQAGRLFLVLHVRPLKFVAQHLPPNEKAREGVKASS